jgi:hypothetical protein
MFDAQIAKYRSLNQLAEADGTVIFGTSSDVNIPLGELKQAFALSGSIYNRSFSELSVANAARVYGECVAELCPDTVIVHIGGADVSDFGGKETEFEENYRTLIGTVREKNKNCRIVIVSLKNYDNDITVAEINKLLCEIADSEKCEFEDISTKQKWNVKGSSENASFIYDIGFVRPLNIKRPIYNLVRILFCYEG